MRIAIVHDALCVSGGAERMVLWLAKAFPQAPVYTSVYLQANTFEGFKALQVNTLPFSRLVKSERQFKLLYPLWYALIQREDFSNFDAVLSSSTYLAKFIRPTSTVRHACYLYAPFRLLWKPESYTPESLPTRGAITSLVKWVTPLLRRWDLKRTREIPKLATTCRNMANEIHKVYNMQAQVIYPPVEIPPQMAIEKGGEYYLSVSRLISHKRVDLAVKACTRLGRQLLVVGDGPERALLEQMAGPTVRFVGRASDEEVQRLFSRARGLIFPSYEDYGIVPLEAQAWGVPVIAFGKGGVLETVKENVSGVFFERQEEDSLVEGIRRFESSRFDAHLIRDWAGEFNGERFIDQVQQFVQAP